MYKGLGILSQLLMVSKYLNTKINVSQSGSRVHGEMQKHFKGCLGFEFQHPRCLFAKTSAAQADDACSTMLHASPHTHGAISISSHWREC